jgi:hypothetical protein
MLPCLCGYEQLTSEAYREAAFYEERLDTYKVVVVRVCIVSIYVYQYTTPNCLVCNE